MGRPLEMTPEERATLIRQGYKPIEIWVPDIENETYRNEAARQAKAAVEADRQAGIVELTDPAAYDEWDKP
ncbi:MAG TPA: antitoxin MazE-like protein [Ensifer sp.]|nr:antitoxin MazE-like protein [Ensifer sp.]